MSGEWRVSLVLGDRTSVPKKVVEDLRVRLGVTSLSARTRRTSEPSAQRSGGAKLLDGVLQIMSETPPF